jgi:SAM-dependent methyltransferase
MGDEVTARHLELHRRILGELGHSLAPGARVLDFGCGEGAMVAEYRNAGYDTYGCDIVRTGSGSDRVNDRFIQEIDSKHYHLPFADDYFDFVFSDQVMEHVQDHASAFAEIKRVMKPGASSLHIFPAKLKPIEAHTFVPLGGALQNRSWLTIWALLAVRNSFQRGKGPHEVADLNFNYLRTRTNYLSKREIRATVETCFDKVTFAEKYFIKHTYGGARRLHSLVQRAPFVASLYSAFYCRVILFQKPNIDRAP